MFGRAEPGDASSDPVPSPAAAQLILERTKEDLLAAIEGVDAGFFRCAVIVLYDPHTKKNHLKMHGDRALINESSMRVLADAGLIQTGFTG
jgi:hypothetical protein